jgi:predicted small secreted protein
MNWKSFGLGLGAGIVGGFAAFEVLTAKRHVSPEKALANGKNHFKQQGPISGSWIHMNPEPYEKGNLSYTVYKGGISRTIDGKAEQYEFIADACTGTIIETKKVEMEND